MYDNLNYFPNILLVQELSLVGLFYCFLKLLTKNKIDKYNQI